MNLKSFGILPSLMIMPMKVAMRVLLCMCRLNQNFDGKSQKTKKYSQQLVHGIGRRRALKKRPREILLLVDRQRRIAELNIDILDDLLQIHIRLLWRKNVRDLRKHLKIRRILRRGNVMRRGDDHSNRSHNVLELPLKHTEPMNVEQERLRGDVRLDGVALGDERKHSR